VNRKIREYVVDIELMKTSLFASEIKNTSFIIIVDLYAIRDMLDTSIILDFFGVEYIDFLEETTMNFSLEEERTKCLF